MTSFLSTPKPLREAEMCHHLRHGPTLGLISLSQASQEQEFRNFCPGMVRGGGSRPLLLKAVAATEPSQLPSLQVCVYCFLPQMGSVCSGPY